MTSQMSPTHSNVQSPSNDLSKYPGTRIHPDPSSPVRMRQPSFEVQQPYSAQIEDGTNDMRREGSHVSRKAVGSGVRPAAGSRQHSIRTVDEQDFASQEWPLRNPSFLNQDPHARTVSEPFRTTPKVYASEYDAPSHDESDVIDPGQGQEEVEQLQYHHTFRSRTKRKPVPGVDHARIPSGGSDSHTASSGEGNSHGSPGSQQNAAMTGKDLSQSMSAMRLGSDLHTRGRSMTPQDLRSDASLSPGRTSRGVSSSGRSPDPSVRVSTMDLLNIPYAQQMAHQTLALDHAQLLGSVGNNASLLDTRKTLDMYRANVKKTNDPAIQYEFAVFMVQAAQEASLPAPPSSMRSSSPFGNSADRAQLLTEARQILQKLADRAYVYAQYYLADGYFSGLFNKGKPDYERAFPLFVSAGKHGHAEAAYRAALCFEFGWGCRKDYAKAVQYYRQAASKNHPGAATRLGLACLHGDMGLAGKQREGVKWLKRATESADAQHNIAPFEFGLLHVNGFGEDVFKDESYAAQLFTKAAELGHAEANLRMGEAYEHGLLNCPKDPALSIHFYTGAAQAGIPKAMMALCAWYIVGAEPVLDKDEGEAYEWARKAAETGYAKAAYAVGYFTEMGIGCRRDPLEANVWYVRAADAGEDHARQRLAIIRAAETGDTQSSAQGASRQGKTAPKKGKSGGGAVGIANGNGAGETTTADDKDCVIM